MVGASKILTVSYGTFSCTLEGFDDPFNTMKAIAEYFRDLAAEDRYFGAEPPQPDAAMLHKIAEREVQRRVEAKIQDNGVILRAENASPAAAPAASEQLSAGDVRAVPGFAAPLAGVDLSYEDAIPAPAAEAAISDSVAAKLSRIRQAVTSSRAAGETTRPPQSLAAMLAAAEAEEKAAAAARVAAEQAEAERIAAEQAEAERIAAEQAEAERIAAEQAEAERIAAEQAEAERIAAEQAEAERIAAEQAEAERIEAEQAEAERIAAEQADAERIAAEQAEADRLALEAMAEIDRLAALENGPVGHDAATRGAQENGAASTVVETLDQITDTPAPLDASRAEEDRILAALSADLDSFDDTTGPASDRFDDDDALQETDKVANGDRLLASLTATLAAGGADPEHPATPPDTAATRSPTADALVDLDPQDTLDGNPLWDAPDLEDDPDEGAVAPAAPLTAPVVQSALDGTGAPSEGLAKAQRARARVIKIRRSALTGAEPSAASAQDAPAQAAASATVSPSRPVSPRRPPLTNNNTDDAVSRLMEQTNTEMQGPENRRRVSAIAHLKAAVAATEADRRAGGDEGPSEETRITPYRSDLERVVRPRRNDSPDATSPRHRAERLAPLMLVSEQRIDRPRPGTSPMTAPSGSSPSLSSSAAPVMPVRPRRVRTGNLAVSAETQSDEGDLDFGIGLDQGGADNLEDETAENIFQGAQSFAEFTEQLGVESLPDLLEAAAAYTACIEGQAQVSRPYLVQHVLNLRPGLRDQREDVLRCFGTLLRDGQIKKVGRGQFAVNEASDILAQARKIRED